VKASHMLDDDRRSTRHRAADFEAVPGDGSLVDLAHRDVEVLVGRGEVDFD